MNPETKLMWKQVKTKDQLVRLVKIPQADHVENVDAKHDETQTDIEVREINYSVTFVS